MLKTPIHFLFTSMHLIRLWHAFAASGMVIQTDTPLSSLGACFILLGKYISHTIPVNTKYSTSVLHCINVIQLFCVYWDVNTSSVLQFSLKSILYVKCVLEIHHQKIFCAQGIEVGQLGWLCADI